MAECFVSEINKNSNSSSKQSSDVHSCQEVRIEEAMEPQLLEDFQRSSIPVNLISLMKVFEDRGVRPSKSDILVGCVYLLMLEYGFVPQDQQNKYNNCDFSYERMKALVPAFDYRKNDDVTYNLSFVLEPYQIYVCRISCIKLGDDLVINAFVRNIKDTQCTVMLDILSYFTDGMNSMGDLKKMQNLRALSTLIKDRIAFPVKHAIMNEVGCRHSCIEDLPLEIIYHIFKFIHGIDIIRFTTTCRRFYTTRLEPKLWEYLLKRDYNISMKSDDYKELLEKYGLVRRSRARSNTVDVWTSRFSYRVTENTLF